MGDEAGGSRRCDSKHQTKSLPPSSPHCDPHPPPLRDSLEASSKVISSMIDKASKKLSEAGRKGESLDAHFITQAVALQVIGSAAFGWVVAPGCLAGRLLFPHAIRLMHLLRSAPLPRPNPYLG